MTAPAHSRRRSLAAVMAATAVFGFVIGITPPMLGLALEARGVSNSMIGLSGAMVALGLIVSSPLVPWAANRYGPVNIMLGCLVLTVLCLIAFGYSQDVMFGLPVRFFLGVAINGLFLISEAWINSIADERTRGRLLGIYATVLAVSFAAGPPLVPLLGVTGWLPYLFCAGVTILAMAPLLAARGLAPDLHTGPPGGNIVRYVFRVPTIMGAIALIALIDFAAFGLLPVYGIKIGFDTTLATWMLTAVAVGNVVMQIPIGLLADRMNRYGVLFMCGAVGLAGSFAIPFVVDMPYVLWPLLFVWGGMAYGLYTVALVLMGERYKGSERVAVNATSSLMWGVGGIIGPWVGGVSMDAAGPHGLLFMVAIACGCFLVLAALRHPHILGFGKA